MAQDTENRIDGQIESASKPQRWNKRLIAIGGIGSSLLIGVPIIGYYIKGKTESLLEFFRIFRENPVWTMGFPAGKGENSFDFGEDNIKNTIFRKNSGQI